MWGRFRWWDRANLHCQTNGLAPIFLSPDNRFNDNHLLVNWSELRNRTGMIGNDQSEFIKFPFKVGFIRKHLKNYQVRPINRVVSSSALPQPSSSLRSWIWPNKAIFIKCKSSDENEINKLGGHFCVSTAHPHCRSSTVDSACPLHLWTVVNLQNSLTSLWSCGICREPTSMGYRPKFTRRIKSELMIVSSF